MNSVQISDLLNYSFSAYPIRVRRPETGADITVSIVMFDDDTPGKAKGKWAWAITQYGEVLSRARFRQELFSNLEREGYKILGVLKPLP